MPVISTDRKQRRIDLRRTFGSWFGRCSAAAGAVRTTRSVAAAAFLLSCPAFGWPALADQFRLAPYKDKLFEYKNVLRTEHDGDFIVVEFDEKRDQVDRDEINLKKVRPEYVSLGVNDKKKDLVLNEGKKPVRYVGVGRTGGGARIVVIFLHGKHGDRQLAMEDWRWGGNFNRLKNLMARNGGVYLTPDFSDFGQTGANEITALMEHQAEISPGAPIIMACASTGCKIVYRLMAGTESAKLLDGVVLLGPLSTGLYDDERFFRTEALRDPAKQIPIVIGQGSQDETVWWILQRNFFRKVKALQSDYPIRFHLFLGASHGTPMRMIDWRQILNWLLQEDQRRPDGRS